MNARGTARDAELLALIAGAAARPGIATTLWLGPSGRAAAPGRMRRIRNRSRRRGVHTSHDLESNFGAQGETEPVSP
jgi:hypothetical protein